MADTCLTIIQNVARRTNLPIPTTVTDNSAQTTQMLGLLNELGQDLVRRYRWQVCTRRVSFTAVNAESQGTLQTLFGTPSLDMIANGTVWDGNLRRPLVGPMDDSQYQNYKNLIPAGPIYQYRIQGDQFLVYPPLPAGHQVNLVIRTKTWVVDQDGITTKEYFSADADTPLLDDKLLTIGLRAAYKQEKGLAYAQDMAKFEEMAMTIAGRDGTKQTLTLDARTGMLTPGIFVPSGSWQITGG